MASFFKGIFVNGTSPPIYDPSSIVNATYDDLGPIEHAWLAWYAWWGNDVLATGVLAFLIHEIVYFGRSIPWVIVDAIPYFRRWKLQPDKIPTPSQQWKCTRDVLLAHFTIELPQIYVFHPMATYFGMKTKQVPFPSLQTMSIQIAIFMIFEDFFHYCAHRALHYGPLYKHIHKKHHEYSAPFGLAAEYAHPLEVLILGFGTIGGPIIWAMLTRDLHIITMFIWVTLRLFQAIDAHSGYDFPWSLHKIIPFWSGAEHHDFHHMTFTNNFSTSFRWWDHILGTDTNFQRHLKKKAALSEARKAKKVE